MQFSKEDINKLWSKEGPITINGKVYRVGKMSYGQYFLEPATWKGGETDGFSSETLWLEIVEGKPNLLQIERGFV